MYFCSCCFCSGFQNFAGDTCSWDFQVINWFTDELCPISAWRNPTQNPVFLLSEPCSPGAHLWMSFAFVFLGKCTKVVRVIILVLLYWLLLGTLSSGKNSFCPVFLCFSSGLCLFFTVSSNRCCKLPLFLKLAFCFFIFHLGGWCEKGNRFQTKAWHACIKSLLFLLSQRKRVTHSHSHRENLKWLWELHNNEVQRSCWRRAGWRLALIIRMLCWVGTSAMFDQEVCFDTVE